MIGALADGQYFGEQVLTEADEHLGVHRDSRDFLHGCSPAAARRSPIWPAQSPSLPRTWRQVRARAVAAAEQAREADIAVAAGHAGEPDLPGTFVDYEVCPREYELSVAQTVLRIHSRVADLYNEPMDQAEQQLRLTIEALRERQEHELVNNPDFGLLHNADPASGSSTQDRPARPGRHGRTACRRRKTRFFLAHPRAIAAFGRECNKRGIYPDTARARRPPGAAPGAACRSCRCAKIPSATPGTTFDPGDADRRGRPGVIGLRQTGLPDEHEPGLNVRFMGIDEKGIISYLVSRVLLRRRPGPRRARRPGERGTRTLIPGSV